MYKKPQCNTGTKPCGKICIPQKYKCHLGKNNSYKKKKDLISSHYKKEKNIDAKEKKSFIDLKTILAGAAVTTIIGGGALMYYRSRNNRVIPTSVHTNVADASTNIKDRQPVGMETLPENPGTLWQNAENTFARVPNPVTREDHIRDNRAIAQRWARDILSDRDTVILDLETTGTLKVQDPYGILTPIKIRGDVPGITQVAAINSSLTQAWDYKLNPERQIGTIASRITGNNNENLKNKPTFTEMYPKLRKMLQGKNVIAFNSRFDLQVIDALCEKHQLPLIEYKNRPSLNSTLMNNESDAMHWYALYIGKGARPPIGRSGYQGDAGLAMTALPTLPNAKAHDALSDVFSTYDVLRRMALGHEPYNMRPDEKKIWDKTL